MSGTPDLNRIVETVRQQVNGLERTVIRMQVEAEFRSEEYLRRLIQSMIDKSIKEYDETSERDSRADMGLRISVISIAIALFMLLITIINLVIRGGGS